jgi:GTP:adenosylcobinamide-phosphate guanylyltransferase
MMPAALVLAGSRGTSDPVALAEGVRHKALAMAGGKTLLERVIGALKEAGVPRIAVSADDPGVVALVAELGAEVLPSAAGPSASVAHAYAVMGTPLLVTTSDHALLEASWVAGFVAGTPTDADVSLLMARREMVEAALPHSRRTWLRFSDADWSGCNLFLLANPRASAAIQTWQMVEANRKRPWRIAMRLGPLTLLAYLARCLTLAGAVRRLGRSIGVRAEVVEATDGLAAVDVDKLSDLADVRLLLSQRADATCSASGSGSS